MCTSSKDPEARLFPTDLSFETAERATAIIPKSCHCPTGVARTIFGKERLDKDD